ncbi:hypothetical protein [Lysinibacillus sp. HST-98]
MLVDVLKTDRLKDLRYVEVEKYYLHKYDSYESLKQASDEYIHFYNHRNL